MAGLAVAEIFKFDPKDIRVGVAKATADKTPIMGLMPWEGTKDQFTWVRENSISAAAFGAVTGAATVSDGTDTFTQVTENLKAIYKQLPIDKAGIYSRGRDVLMREVYARLAASLSNKFNDAFINGSGTGNEFSGLKDLCDDASRGDLATSAANGQVLSFDILDQLVDGVEGISAIFMSHAARRKLSALIRGVGGTDQHFMIDGYGQFDAYSNVPIIPMNQISDTETQGTTNTCTTIFGVKFGTDGLHGIYQQALPLGLELEELGTVTDALAENVRGTLWSSIVARSVLAIGAVKGINVA